MAKTIFKHRWRLQFLTDGEEVIFETNETDDLQIEFDIQPMSTFNSYSFGRFVVHNLSETLVNELRYLGVIRFYVGYVGYNQDPELIYEGRAYFVYDAYIQPTDYLRIFSWGGVKGFEDDVSININQTSNSVMYNNILSDFATSYGITYNPDESAIEFKTLAYSKSLSIYHANFSASLVELQNQLGIACFYNPLKVQIVAYPYTLASDDLTEDNTTPILDSNSGLINNPIIDALNGAITVQSEIRPDIQHAKSLKINSAARTVLNADANIITQQTGDTRVNSNLILCLFFRYYGQTRGNWYQTTRGFGVIDKEVNS